MTASPSSAVRPRLSVVVPVYREQDNIRPFLERLVPTLERMGISYEVLFSLDPSTDGTEEAILSEVRRNPRLRLIVFSRRFGQPAATWTGIMESSGECVAVIDVDLQDPPEMIDPMYRKMAEGYDVVYAKRRSRKGETLAKRIVSNLGYKLINRVADVQIPRDTGDFRIMSRRVVEELRRLSETHGFLRGLVAYVGFPQTFVEYDRAERFLGRGKYNRFTGSLRIGLNGLISFSSYPLKVISVFGMILSLFSFALGMWYVVQKFVLRVELTPGLPTTVLLVTFFAGIQLFSLGVMGEYVGRIYDEVKRRPVSVIQRKVNFDTSISTLDDTPVPPIA